jgi:hypothetical protein
MIVRPATFPALWIDTASALGDADLDALWEAGIRGIFRYLGSVTTGELDRILTRHPFEFMPVTFGHQPGWMPSHAMGEADGAVDVGHLEALSIPRAPAPSIWLDLEQTSGGPLDTAAWTEARAARIAQGGYSGDSSGRLGGGPGLYVGAGQPLTSDGLYQLSGIRGYWHSLSRVVDFRANLAEPACGWQCYQLYKTIRIGGVEVDCNVVQYDRRERLPMVVAAS